MQPQEIDKIKQLVKSSSLLSQTEREEWLVLSGLMNDKQLWELREILSSNTQPQIQNIRPALSEIPQYHPVRGTPPLTHIMNLPKAGTAVFPHQEVRSKNQEVRVEEKKTKFWQKIKDVLEEKELPAGHLDPVKELELPARIQQAPVAPPLPVASPQAPKQDFKQQDFKRETEFSVGTLRVDKLVVSGEGQGQAETGGQLAQEIIKKNEARAGEKQNQAQRVAPNFPLKGNFSKQISEYEMAQSRSSEGREDERQLITGLEDPGILVEARIGGKAKGPSFQEEAAKISSLEEAGRLSSSDLAKNIALPLKNLAASFGYHRLVLSFEKSPLFQSYIATGLAALSGKRDLDAPAPGGQLSRREFEKMADVLRAIKN